MNENYYKEQNERLKKYIKFTAVILKEKYDFTMNDIIELAEEINEKLKRA